MLKIYPYCVLFHCNNESNLLINSVREINNKRQCLIYARKPSWIIIVFQHIHGVRLIFNDEDDFDVDSEVDDFGHQIPRDPGAKMREIHRILQESTGNRWNMEAVFRVRNWPDFFRWIPVNFLCFPTGTGPKSSEKSEKFPAGILLPQNHWNYPEPPLSGQVCSTWHVKTTP